MSAGSMSIFICVLNVFVQLPSCLPDVHLFTRSKYSLLKVQPDVGCHKTSQSNKAACELGPEMMCCVFSGSNNSPFADNGID